MRSDKAVTYCIYTDRDIAEADASDEHVIPLALGGSNKFTVRVSRDFNSKVGARLDGAMANDFVIAMNRTKYDARGHSGRKPTVHLKNARWGPDERPAQVQLSVTDGMRVWDALKGRELSKAETAGHKISWKHQLDIGLRSQFVAKVSLAAGFFVYGDLFRQAVRHNELRAVMNLREGEDLTNYLRFTIRGDDPLSSPKPRPSEQLGIIRGGCEAVKGSVVMLVPSGKSVMIAVGILGHYVGMLNVDADTSRFPNSGHYRWGHVIVLRRGATKRCSFRAFLQMLAGVLPPPSRNS
jgi:hypothetical protein